MTKNQNAKKQHFVIYIAFFISSFTDIIIFVRLFILIIFNYVYFKSTKNKYIFGSVAYI